MGGWAASEACCTVVGPDSGTTVAVRSAVHGSAAAPGMHSHSMPEASVLDAAAPRVTAACTAVSVPVVVVVVVVDADPADPQAAATEPAARRATIATGPTAARRRG